VQLVDQSIMVELTASGRLPSPTGVALTILDLTRDPNTSTEDMALVLKGDPSLTGQILKYANSADSGARNEITSINDALVRLGMSMVRQLCLGFSVLSNARSGPCESFDYQHYWKHSLAQAVSCQSLTKRIPSVTPDEGFTCGLLCGIGRLALASVYPQDYGSIMKRLADGDRHRLRALEQEVLSIDHNQVSTVLFEDWGLPEYYQIAVARHETIELDEMPKGAGRKERGLKLAGLLQVSTLAANICLEYGPKRHEMVLEFLSIGDQLGFTEENWIQLYDDTMAEWSRMGDVLDILTSSVPAMEALVARARQYRPADSGPSGTEEASGQDDPTSNQVNEGADGQDTTVQIDGTDEAEAQGLEILLVAENVADPGILQETLVGAGHRLSTASDGREALTLALKSNPQMILTDLDLAELDGFELCRTLRQSRQVGGVYLIVMSSSVDGDAMVEAFEAGADDFLLKPLDQRVLTARLGAARRLIELQEQAARNQEEIRVTVAELGIANRRLQLMALEDQLTMLPNRRAGLNYLEKEWARSVRTDEPLLVMVLDIDHFKNVNDTWGHDAGDVVLQETALVLRDQMRTSDTVCRFGGEEFLVICPNADVEVAKVLGDRLRAAIQDHNIEMENFRGSVTVSVGVAVRSADHESPKDLIKEADQALYAAKEAGRNLVCIAASD